VIGAGTFINPLIKVLVTVAILGAIYLFFVKPALDTSEDISNSVNESIGRSFDSANDSIDKAFNNPAVNRAQKLGECVTKAGGNVDKINKCHEKF
jgi:hypothetical protein